MQRKTLSEDIVQWPLNQQEKTHMRQHRVQKSKKQIMVRELMRNILFQGKMQKMDLVALNNRSMFKQGKVKRAIWSNKKAKSSPKSFLPAVNELKIVTRSPTTRKNHRYHSDRDLSQDQELCESLITEYIQKLKQKEDISLNKNLDVVVEEACEEIGEKIQDFYQQKLAHSSNSRPRQRKKSFDFLEKERKNQRLIIEAKYNSMLEKVQLSSDYNAKLRLKEQKKFLHRIKLIGLS